MQWQNTLNSERAPLFRSYQLRVGLPLQLDDLDALGEQASQLNLPVSVGKWGYWI